MVENLAKLREPAVWIVLGWLWLRALLILVQSVGGDGVVGSLAGLSQGFLGSSLGFLVLGGLVACCACWQPTRNARTLTLLALITVGALTVFGFLFSFASFSFGPTYGLLNLIDVVIPGLVALGIFTVFGALPAPAPRQQAIAGGYGGYPPPGQPYGQQQPGQDWSQQGPYGGGIQSQPGQSQPGQSQPGQSQPGQSRPGQPTWQPGQAAGQSWSTAGEAASGAAGSATGQQWGGPQGWGSAPGPQSSTSAAEYAGPVPFPPAQPGAPSWGQPVHQPFAPPAAGSSASPSAAPEPTSHGSHALDESAMQTRLVPPARSGDPATEQETAADDPEDGSGTGPAADGIDGPPPDAAAPSWWDSPGR